MRGGVFLMWSMENARETLIVTAFSPTLDRTLSMLLLAKLASVLADARHCPPQLSSGTVRSGPDTSPRSQLLLRHCVSLFDVRQFLVGRETLVCIKRTARRHERGGCNRSGLARD